MRFIIGFFVITLMSGYIQRQTIKDNYLLGVWQFGSKEINAGFFDSYQFFSDGTFKFNTNQNDATRRIISIGGTYKIKDKLLSLKTTYVKEIQGGFLVRSETTGGSGWEINGGKLVKIIYKIPKISSLNLERCINEEGCILLDKRKYYKVEEDPNSFD